MNKTTKHWQLIHWDGNPDLGFQCWRKKFRHGHVSVGAGDFQSIVYSYGHNSDDSMSSTRNCGTYIMSEQDAMAMVDANNGIGPGQGKSR